MTTYDSCRKLDDTTYRCCLDSNEKYEKLNITLPVKREVRVCRDMDVEMRNGAVEVIE